MKEKYTKFGGPLNCTHPVPENKYGIFALHTCSNTPIPLDELKAVIEGPIARIQEDLARHRSVMSDDRADLGLLARS